MGKIKLWYDSLSETMRNVIKGLAGTGIAVTLWRLARSYADATGQGGLSLLTVFLDLISLPIRWAVSIVGDVLGALGLERVAEVTDGIVGDWSEGGEKQGVIGELVQMVDNALRDTPPGKRYDDKGRLVAA